MRLLSGQVIEVADVTFRKRPKHIFTLLLLYFKTLKERQTKKDNQEITATNTNFLVSGPGMTDNEHFKI